MLDEHYVGEIRCHLKIVELTAAGGAFDASSYTWAA